MYYIDQNEDILLKLQNLRWQNIDMCHCPDIQDVRVVKLDFTFNDMNLRWQDIDVCQCPDIQDVRVVKPDFKFDFYHISQSGIIRLSFDNIK